MTREAKRNPRRWHSKAYGTANPIIFHLKHLGPRAIEYITALFNLSVKTCQIPSIWKLSLIIPIPKSGTHTTQGTSNWPFSLLCPENSYSNIHQQISPACSRPARFQTRALDTSALLQLTIDIAVGFNQRKPPDRTVCAAVDQ